MKKITQENEEEHTNTQQNAHGTNNTGVQKLYIILFELDTRTKHNDLLIFGPAVFKWSEYVEQTNETNE